MYRPSLSGTSATAPLWQSVRSYQLEPPELVRIAGAIERWSGVARCLGLSEQEIVTIRENYVHDYEEQKFQMLLKWTQTQSTPTTGQDLVRIIEEEKKDPTLAQQISNIIGTNST